MAGYGHGLQPGFILDPTAGSPGRANEIAHLLDGLGHDLIGIHDNPYQPRHFDTLALIGFILGQTRRIRVFPDGANLPLRPPAILAKQAATLDHLGGCRFELGLSAGAFWDGSRAMSGLFRTLAEALKAPAGSARRHPLLPERPATAIPR